MIAIKVDADPRIGDFSGERVRRSTEENLGRLSVDPVPVLYLHDPEFHLTFRRPWLRAVRSRPWQRCGRRRDPVTSVWPEAAPG